MEVGSEGEMDRNVNQSPTEGSKRPKRQMKTPFQLEMLENTYTVEMYPSEATRAELSGKLNLTDRQLQMWFCHRRLKDKKETLRVSAIKPHVTGNESSPRKEMIGAEPGSRNDSRSDSGSRLGSSEFGDGNDMTDEVVVGCCEISGTNMQRRVIACVEEQLGEPLREEEPILGIEFDELPPGAFGAPIVPAEQRDRYKHAYETNSYAQYDSEHIKALSSCPHEAMKPEVRFDAHRNVPQAYLYDSSADCNTTKTPTVHENGHFPREYGADNLLSSAAFVSQPRWQAQFHSFPMFNDFNLHDEDNVQTGKKRKNDDARNDKEIQAREKKLRKELEKQDLLRLKMEEQLRKDIERQERERQKEEQRKLREQQKEQEKFQREEKREMERQEKLLKKEHLLLQRRKQKEEQRKEKEASRQKTALKRATARRIAKESMELIEDDRLELMELAASSKGLSSIVSLDYETLQSLDSFRGIMCDFPPKSVRLELPFAIQPWVNSEENVGNLLMVWKFCVSFSDVLGLWPFTIDEFVQAFHDHDSRLLGELHIALLKLIIKDIEDVMRTPSGGPGTNQYSAINPEGGHPRIVEGAHLWGFDIRNWQKHLNPLTWPEILRQFALSTGFGPQLRKKSSDHVGENDIDETKGSEDIVSTLRNGSAAENAIAIMQVKGLTLQRRSRHRLTPGTVKFAAYNVLALEGTKGLNVIDIADKIQKSGLRDLSTSKTPEASISVALSRDPVLFERIAPSTYCVRDGFRKDPADRELIIAEAKEKIQKFANGILAGQNVQEEERDEDSDSDVADCAEIDAISTQLNEIKNEECINFDFSLGNGKVKFSDDTTLSGSDGINNLHQGFDEIDERGSGEPWVQGITEAEYSDLSVEERLNALVTLVSVANEGNSVRVILEDRLDAANALKKQMWAETQLEKRRIREEIICKLYDSNSKVVTEDGLGLLGIPEDKFYVLPEATLDKDLSFSVAKAAGNSIGSIVHDTNVGPFMSAPQQNVFASERMSLQLKSYIGHKAEEMYVYRSLPLGQDRRRNRYWQFVASASSLDPGWGRVFVESPTGYWRLIDSEEAFDALLKSLDTRGTRESHLHLLLQKVESYFKDCVQRNHPLHNIMDQRGYEDGAVDVNLKESALSRASENPRNACSTSPNLWEPSGSFKTEIGRNELKTNNSMKRCEDLYIWIWRECFHSSTLCAKKHGNKRCLPLLGVCDVCLATYDAKEDVCPHCRWTRDHIENGWNLSEQFKPENDLIYWTKTGVLNSSLPTIRLIKAMLILFEVCVPSEGLHSHWTEECRNSWGLSLQNSSSAKELLQLLTQLESAIKRDYLSTEFETTNELLGHSVSSRVASYEFPYIRSVSQLPWIPETTAAVTLRLLELDASVFYSPDVKAESCANNSDGLPMLSSRFPCVNDVQNGENIEFDNHGLIVKGDSWNYCDPTFRPGDRNVIRGRGGGRSRRRLRGVTRPTSPSGRRSMKQGGTSTQTFVEQRVVKSGQKRGQGRRTMRRRWTEKKAVAEIVQNCLDGKITFENVIENPETSMKEESPNFRARNTVENDVNSNSMESDDSDESLYEFAKWGTSPYSTTPNRRNEMREEEVDEIEINEGDCGNVEGDVELDYGEWEQDGDVNMEESWESAVSGDYSD